MPCRDDILEMPGEMAEALTESSAKADIFESAMALQGEMFRDVHGRRTLRFSLLGKSYFAKLHEGVGWGEIFKNLLTLRLPILGAMTEVRAIQKLDQVGIPTTPLVAYGVRGCSPASLRSFVVTEDLGDIVSLETLCADWPKNPPDARFKRRLIIAVAILAHIFHGNGMNHRDFYICHFYNPRHLRVIQAVSVRPIPREQLDTVAGCSNGPDLVAELRRRGLDMPCTRTKKRDRDFFDTWPGVYHLTQQDRRRLDAWKRRRAARGQS